jgi:uncharacterized protein (DUF983 family)
MASMIRKFLLPKCPVCGHGNWPTISRESSRRLCVSCGSELEEQATRNYIARFVLIVMWFVVPVIVVGYTRSPLVIVAILTTGAYCYLRITKFVSADQNKSSDKQSADETK